MGSDPSPSPEEATVRELKCWPSFFQAIVDGMKTWEVRRDDRGYRAGDVLLLREWDHMARPFPQYTGAEFKVRVTYIVELDGIGIPEHVGMSIEPLTAALRLYDPDDDAGDYEPTPAWRPPGYPEPDPPDVPDPPDAPPPASDPEMVELLEEHDLLERAAGMYGMEGGALHDLIMRRRSADAMAAAVDLMVKRGILDARSYLADARLQYGDPITDEATLMLAIAETRPTHEAEHIRRHWLNTPDDKEAGERG